MSNIKNLEVNYDMLSDEKKRDLYLRKLATGEIQGPPTGYPDVDKIWLSRYSIDSIISKAPKKTVYQYFYDLNKDNKKNAINFFGTKISFQFLFEKIDECAKSLVALGIKKGDVIGIAAPTTPETVYLMYAANKIGAIINVIDLRKTNEDLKHEISEGNTKVLFIYDGDVERIGSIADKCGVTSSIAISPVSTLPTYKQFLAGPKQFVKNVYEKKNSDRSYLLFDEFMDFGKNISSVPTNDFDENDVAFLAHTSGTTNKSKTVALSNGTINNVVNQYMNNGMEYYEQDNFFSAIPIFLVFGITLGIHMPMCMGLEMNIIPQYDIYKMQDYFKKNNIVHTAFPPSAYIELINSKRYNKERLKNSITLGSGADGISATEEKKIDRLLFNFLTHGYGGTEVGSSFATEIVGKECRNELISLRNRLIEVEKKLKKYSNKDKREYLLKQRLDIYDSFDKLLDKTIACKPGSSGIPLPGNNVMILDHLTGEKLKYNQVGDIVMIVDYPMLEYVNRDDLTSDTKIKLDNGKYGVKLNDAGYVSDDGFLYVKGRYENAIVDDKTIIWPIDIENILYLHDDVQQCAVIGKNSSDVSVFVKTKRIKNIDQFLLELQTLLFNNYPNLHFNISLVEKIPLTSNGKIDRKILIKSN